MSAPPDIWIDDLSDPVLPDAVVAMNDVTPEVARERVSLDEAGLLEEARAKTGLEDFGGEGFREGLGVLLEALEREADLTLMGRMSARGQIVKLLVNRLRLEELVARRPEAAEAPLERPVIIVGLPRTGTSHLHNLLSGHPDLRFLPYWESTEPIAGPDDQIAAGQPDPRIARAQAALDQGAALIPYQQAMHELTAETPHEEIGFLQMDFACPLFSTMFHVPSYRKWYCSKDQREAYAYARRVLRVISFLRESGKRWVLKSPMHLEQIGPLMATFPDARVLLTFRDPARVTLSLATMTCYGRRLVQRRIDPAEVGRQVSEMTRHRFDSAVRDAHLIPSAQRFDVHFHDYMQDPLATVREVLAFAELDASEATMDRMKRYQDAHPRGKFGRVRYRYEDVGLDPKALRGSAETYMEHFGVRPEPD